MIDRHINLIGASNFRDLGGYETEDGMRLKYGVIYRSDNLSHLTDIDLKKINEIGIKTVCDLRSDNELDEFPSPFSRNSIPVLKHIPIKTLGTKDLRELSIKDGVTSEEMAQEMPSMIMTLCVKQ